MRDRFGVQFNPASFLLLLSYGHDNCGKQSLNRALACLQNLIGGNPKATFYLYSADLNSKNMHIEIQKRKNAKYQTTDLFPKVHLKATCSLERACLWQPLANSFEFC